MAMVVVVKVVEVVKVVVMVMVMLMVMLMSKFFLPFGFVGVRERKKSAPR